MDFADEENRNYFFIFLELFFVRGGAGSIGK